MNKYSFYPLEQLASLRENSRSRQVSCVKHQQKEKTFSEIKHKAVFINVPAHDQQGQSSGKGFPYKGFVTISFALGSHFYALLMRSVRLTHAAHFSSFFFSKHITPSIILSHSNINEYCIT